MCHPRNDSQPATGEDRKKRRHPSDGVCPVSSARIVAAGADKEDVKVGDLITGWCDIEDVDIGTSASVFFTLPDGTKTQTEYIAVNRNQRVYAELMIETAGEYEMVWELTNGETIKTTILAT